LLAKVVRVKQTKYDRTWITLSCGHRLLCVDSLYWNGLNIECESCTQLESMKVGFEYDVKFTYCAEPQLCKHMGRHQDLTRLILPTGQSEFFNGSEIQWVKLIR
jgi:hypothetical protein